MKTDNGLRAADYKSRAKESLKGKYWPAVGITALSTLIIGGGSGLSFNFGSSGEFFSKSEGASVKVSPISDEFIPLVAGVIATIAVFLFAVLAVQFILAGVTQMGLARYNIKLCMGEDAKIGDLFAYYKTRLGTGILATFLTNLFICLWSMLLFFPGIIAAYRYTLVPYLLAEDETLGASEAIKRSKELMKGNKWKLFCLDMSFIGWVLLGTLACGVGTYFVLPYSNNARAQFYCELVGKNNAVELDDNAQMLDYEVADDTNTEAI